MNKEQGDLSAAVADLTARLDAGQEWPDASSAVGRKYQVTQADLSAAFDDAEIDRMEAALLEAHARIAKGQDDRPAVGGSNPWGFIPDNPNLG